MDNHNWNIQQQMYNMSPQPPKTYSNAFSIVSLVCGIVANVTCCGGIIFGLVGIAFGIASIVTKPKEDIKVNLKMIFGLVLSSIGIILGFIIAYNCNEFYWSLRGLS